MTDEIMPLASTFEVQASNAAYLDDEDAEPEHVNLYEADHFEQAANDPEIAEILHYHVESNASDCDGPLSRWSTRKYVDWVADGADDDDRSVRAFFHHFVQGGVIYNANPDVSIREDGTWSITSGGPTEEGYHHEEYRSCIDPYCMDERGQRDVYAERMGY